MEESIQRQIREIANNAITEISRISQLVTFTQTETIGTQRSSSTSSPLQSGSESVTAGNQQSYSTSSPLPSGSASARPTGSASGASAGSLVSELHRRFPTMQGTTQRSSTLSARGSRGRANSTQRVGRPSKEFAIKDIVIVGLQCEKTPTTRQEKVSLQRRNRVISGFNIDKGWNEKTLYNRVKAQFPEECKGIEFEFVKNVSGVLVKPTLASGVRIDGNILLRSIASSGVVYVRLLVEDNSDEEDDNQRSMDEFMSEANHDNPVQSIATFVQEQGHDQERNNEVQHAVESADDQERNNEIQHAFQSVDVQEQENGEQHVVQPGAKQPLCWGGANFCRCVSIV